MKEVMLISYDAYNSLFYPHSHIPFSQIRPASLLSNFVLNLFISSIADLLRYHSQTPDWLFKVLYKLNFYDWLIILLFKILP